jgi:uncharacterized protein YdhG (YjbR/CyaY superfamily)
MLSDEDMASHYSRHHASQSDALVSTFRAFQQALPGGKAVLSWSMPSIALGKTPALSLEGFARHNSVFPGPGVIARLGDALTGYTVTKGTIHCDRDRPMARALVKAIARAAVESINDRYPKSDGTFLEFYDNGWLKQQGKYREGEMHGEWSWYRRDGSLMRRGRFERGVQRGVWQTFVREGGLHSSKSVG